MNYLFAELNSRKLKVNVNMIKWNKELIYYSAQIMEVFPKLSSASRAKIILRWCGRESESLLTAEVLSG